MGILCNHCYRELTEKEVSVYPLQWQYSGDMYCTKHETRQQFKQKEIDLQAAALTLGGKLFHDGIPHDFIDENGEPSKAYKAVLAFIADNEIKFTSLDQRGEFMYNVGRGYALAQKQSK